MAVPRNNPPCAADVGTAMTGPKICGRTSRHFARCADSASMKHRRGFPCCGICARKLDRIGFEIFRETVKDPIVVEVTDRLKDELGRGADVRPVSDRDGVVVGFVARESFRHTIFNCYDRTGEHLGESGHNFGIGEACDFVRTATRA